MRNPIIFLALLILPCALSAQRHYTLTDAIMQGIEGNYSVKLAQNSRDVASNNMLPTPFLPVVTAGGKIQNDNPSTNEAYTNADDIKKSYTANTYGADATLTWRIFDGMAMFATYQTQRELLAQGELNLRSSIENIVADISQQYYYIITQENRLKATQRYLEISTMRYNQALEKYTIGSISGLEMKQAKIDFNADSSRYVLQQEVIDNAYITFRQMLNIDLSEVVVLGDSIVPNGNLLMGELINSAQSNNTAILSAMQGEKLSQLDLRIARSSRYPTLDFNAQYRINRSDNSSQAYNFSRTSGPLFGVTASVRLFDGLQTNRRIKNAKIGISTAELLYQQTVQDVTRNIMQLYNTYRKNFTMITFEDESAEAAMLNMEAAMEMYRLGTMSGIEFREIQRSYIDAEDRRLEALYQAKTSEINLRFFSGTILYTQRP